MDLFAIIMFSSCILLALVIMVPPRLKKCPHCEGEKMVIRPVPARRNWWPRVPCTICNGTGQVSRRTYKRYIDATEKNRETA